MLLLYLSTLSSSLYPVAHAILQEIYRVTGHLSVMRSTVVLFFKNITRAFLTSNVSKCLLFVSASTCIWVVIDAHTC